MSGAGSTRSAAACRSVLAHNSEQTIIKRGRSARLEIGTPRTAPSLCRVGRELNDTFGFHVSQEQAPDAMVARQLRNGNWDNTIEQIMQPAP